MSNFVLTLSSMSTPIMSRTSGLPKLERSNITMSSGMPFQEEKFIDNYGPAIIQPPLPTLVRVQWENKMVSG